MSRDESSMYQLKYPSPELSCASEQEEKNVPGLTMLVALEGYADAGHAVDGVSRHLMAALDHRPIASFNVDELFDYRSRRPPVAIEDQRIIGFEQIRVTLNVVRDVAGKPFLLLTGPEPDLRWQEFGKAVSDLATHFNVDQTIVLYSAPMTVPHTRPLVVSAHGNSARLVEPLYIIESQIIVPGSAALSIEHYLDQDGHDVAGYTAHVPHYVAASEYPEAILNLLQAIGDVGDLVFPLKSLHIDDFRVKQDLARQTAESAEIQQVVGEMEREYDKEIAVFRVKNPDSPFLKGYSIPGPEELGKEFEYFLARLEKDVRLARGEEESYQDVDKADPDNEDPPTRFSDETNPGDRDDSEGGEPTN